MIIFDREIIEPTTKGTVFELLKYFENSDEVLVLEAFEKLPEFSTAKDTRAKVYHLIDFNCPMLEIETKMALGLLV